MMNCREATRLLSEAQDRKLTLAENVELKFHTMMCSGCRNFGKQMSSLRSFMSDYARPEQDDLRKPSDPDADKSER
ncbi:zf-HC2 domain-containing protein [Oceanobacter kriegii]|uniref:zf-HC2 domain-containing protein n=1 Tax=Oceanobacter kriegii TaxID=64972 RepID=UPI0004095A18|nr:zf-HC2 domain-containing protein [Oceanobacter kriegii]